MPSVTPQNPYNRYSANGVTTAFPFTFHVLRAGDLVVEVDGEPASNYSISGVGTQAGGLITFSTAPAAGVQNVLIYRSIPLSRSIEYATNGDFRAATVNQDFNLIWHALQNLTSQFGGEVRAPYPEQLDFLPASTARYDRLFCFDEITGQPNVTTFTQTQVASVLAAIYAAAAGPLDALSFLQGGTGAISMSAQEALRLVAVMPQHFGAVGDFVNDDTAAINKAIARATTLGKILLIPAGYYSVTPATAATDEAGATMVAFPMASNLHIVAEPGAVFKIADNVSNDVAPQRMAMFFSNGVLENLSFRGLTMDMNGANNKISPLRGVGTYNVYTQAHILFSGTPAGVAARGEHVLIENCKFLNTAGATCIGMGQTGTVGTILGKDWKIRGCRFYNNGLDTNDHSSIYAWANDVLCEGNTFDAPAMPGTVGAKVAYEIHGANQRFVHNNIDHYYQSVWVAGNSSTDSENNIVAFNHMRNCGVCVDFYREDAAEQGVQKTHVKHNTMVLTDDATLITLKVGVQLVATYSVYDVLIEGNTLTKIGTTVGSAFFYTGPQAEVCNHDRITVRGNKVIGTTFGAAVVTNATNGYGSLVIEHNEWHELMAAGAYGTAMGISGVGINAAGPVSALVIGGNKTIAQVTPIPYAISLAGAVTALFVDEQFTKGVATPYYEAPGFTATARYGHYDAVALTAAFTSSGTPVTVGNGEVQSQYALHGHQVTVNGRFTLGSTSSISPGVLIFTAPFNAATAGIPYEGTWRALDASGVVYKNGVASLDGTSNLISFSVDGAGAAGPSSPFTFTTGDELRFQISYTRVPP